MEVLRSSVTAISLAATHPAKAFTTPAFSATNTVPPSLHVTLTGRISPLMYTPPAVEAGASLRAPEAGACLRAPAKDPGASGGAGGR
jgi:hypothetical protein